MIVEAARDAVAEFGFSARQAGFLVFVLRQAGVCACRPYEAYAGIAHGQKAHDFADLVARRFPAPYPLGRVARRPCARCWRALSRSRKPALKASFRAAHAGAAPLPEVLRRLTASHLRHLACAWREQGDRALDAAVSRVFAEALRERRGRVDIGERPTGTGTSLRWWARDERRVGDAKGDE